MTPSRGGFHARAAEALRNKSMLSAVQATTMRKQHDRRTAWAELRDVEALRELASQIKRHTLTNLDTYIRQFANRVRSAGGTIHIASTREDAVQIITQIARRSGARLCVQAKTMTGEEIGLRHALERVGVQTVDTDLGEFVLQIDGDTPSHIVTPIIHKDRRAIARSLTRELGGKYTEDAVELTAAVRRHMRDVFRRCDMGISGVNFAVAETGTLCICTNEGNGRYVVSRPRVHVALMGIEKIVPRMADLPVFLKLLARSATGQRLTQYTTLITGPKRPDDPDGPEELHVVIMDAGRSEILGGPFQDSLACIRCGACLNACPVYRQVGGHAYGSTYPGPIGKIISPLLQTSHDACELPHASSLCGACLEACPVKIDIPQMLIEHRTRQVEERRIGRTQFLMLRAASAVARSPTAYRLAQRLIRILTKWRAHNGWVARLRGPARGWTDVRDLPVPPKQTFRDWWDKEQLDG